MSDTLIILGIDAADYDLLTRWNCENLLLDNHAEIETFTHSLDTPTTLEVWPSLATGVRPDRHGIVPDPTERSQTPFWKQAAIAGLSRLPKWAEIGVRRLKQNQYESTFPVTDHDHVFEAGSVYNWPGVTPCYDWSEESDWFKAVSDGEMTDMEFRRRHLGNAGKGIGWLLGQAATNVSIAGAHIHILDHMGHLYGNRPDRLRASYEAIDEMVGIMQDRVDSLIVVSDHGMQTTVTEDPDPGVHSPRATFATTEPGPLPDSILDIRAWLAERLDHHADEGMNTGVDAPREHLENLGYL